MTFGDFFVLSPLLVLVTDQTMHIDHFSIFYVCFFVYREPMNFVVGNDDHNAYTFDMRKLDQPTKIFKGHMGKIYQKALETKTFFVYIRL